jgi:hypothetical protein
MDDLTEWFDPSVKPIRVGAYQTKEPDNDTFFNYWDGHKWHWGCRNPIHNNSPMPKDRVL